ncbi:hypothetical protein [Blautia obeum]|uniref:hypothetical protein n=1 Tax=Blautia obeum TaxID=40520 RepID=UPI003CFD1A62
MGTVKQEEQLERIADALEVISEELRNINSNLGELTECVGYVPPRGYQREGYHIFRIGGCIDVDN